MLCVGSVFKKMCGDFWMMKSAPRCVVDWLSAVRCFIETEQYVSDDFVDWFYLLET